MNTYRIPFGRLKIGPRALTRLNDIVAMNWVSEGRYVKEFEERFGERFGWRHVIACSSGTDAGIVVWAAVRCASERDFGYGATVLTPACAFAATANCLVAAGLKPGFIDIDLDTLNINAETTMQQLHNAIGVQFVATMGKPKPLHRLAASIGDQYLIGDFCEGHGALLYDNYADKLCDAAIYSFYAAHLIIGGEGGAICTDDDELAELCRSIKSHGRPAGSNYFNFQRIGYNSKWNEFCAAVALDSLERFDEVFNRRREVRVALLRELGRYSDNLILYDDDIDETISPHAFPIVLRDGSDITGLYNKLEAAGVQCKTLFGSLPTQHDAFKFICHENFPIAERVGRSGLHFGCHEDMTLSDIKFIGNVIGDYLKTV